MKLIGGTERGGGVCFLNEQPICILNFAPEENGRGRAANNKYIDNREGGERVG